MNYPYDEVNAFGRRRYGADAYRISITRSLAYLVLAAIIMIALGGAALAALL